MKEFDPVREFIFDYITVVVENTLAIAVIGSIFVRDASISFIKGGKLIRQGTMDEVRGDESLEDVFLELEE